MRTGWDLDFGSTEINLISLVLKDPRPHTSVSEREREREAGLPGTHQSPGEGLRYHCYNGVNAKYNILCRE